jgi:hypothetical protein
MLPEHATEVLAIFQAGIDGGNATFETAAPVWEAFDAGKLADHRFVALDAERVLGWIVLSPISDRCALAGIAEVSVYVPDITEPVPGVPTVVVAAGGELSAVGVPADRLGGPARGTYDRSW